MKGVDSDIMLAAWRLGERHAARAAFFQAIAPDLARMHKGTDIFDSLRFEIPAGAGRASVGAGAIRPLVEAAIVALREDRTRVKAAIKILMGDDRAAQRKRIAAAITREIEARADELRRQGVRNPITQAENELAGRYQHASGDALNRWLRRNR